MSIDFQVIRKHRRKTLTIKVTEVNDVLVYAPQWVSTRDISLFVTEKSRWIERVVERNRQNVVLPKQFVSGEPFLFLGNEYTLMLDQSDTEGVSLNASTLTVCLNSDIPAHLKKDKIHGLLLSWYKSQAIDIFYDRVSLYEKDMGVSSSSIRVKSMKTRWGSCSSKGSLNFNFRLVMAPLLVLDYVVVHELCHLRHMNHSRLFWEFVQSVMPDYKEHKQWIRQNGHILVF